jgi:cytochrome c biogenesis protein CcmG, thiol:disulfide interchange protein DsbE
MSALKEAAAPPDEGKAAERPRLLRAFLPLAIFVALAGLLYAGLQSGDPHTLPSVLIGKPVPQFTLPGVEGLIEKDVPVPGFQSADLRKGKVSIVNVWASWCVPCHQEHPYLTALAKRSQAPLFGLNNKDDAAAARRFLGRYGNPYTAVGADAAGRVAIDWGVYGVPETFIVSGDGTILHKHIGPIGEGDVASLQKIIEQARAGS